MKTDQEIDDSAKLSATWFTNKRGSIEEQQIEFHSHKQGFIAGYKQAQRDAEAEDGVCPSCGECFDLKSYQICKTSLVKEIQSLKSQLGEKDKEIEKDSSARGSGGTGRMVNIGSEVSQLHAQVRDLRKEIDSLKSQLSEKDAELSELKRQNVMNLSARDVFKSREAKLVECLKFYAQESINHSNYHAMMGTDLNKHARKTLKELFNE